jgi:DNA-binding NtrC family response regulator
MPSSRILVVDEDNSVLQICAETLQKLPEVEVDLQQEGDEAIRRLSSDKIDLLIVDRHVNGLDGMELFKAGRRTDPNLSVLILTDAATATTAVECMRIGAADYITKPFQPEEFLATVKHLLEAKRLREEHQSLQWQVVRSHSFDGIVGRSPAMRVVFKTIHLISETDVDVLIVGETGTGKELVARSIHNRSHRRVGPFIAVDCGAIPDNLLESELFGYEKGAFTGAESRSIGLLEMANKGTFFLDEVGELPVRLQAKLLRSLQERKIRRLGGKEEIPLDVRIIAATSRDLVAEIREQRFRDDLYYRINVARIELPPLRARSEDIPLLISHFVTMYCQQMDKGVVEVDPEVTDVLSRYSWPGNVRELQNVLKRALAMTRHHVLTVEDLPVDIAVQGGERRRIDRGGFFQVRAQRIAAFEKWYLSNLLRSCQGDVSRAARKAELPRGTLYRLLKKHNVNPDDFRA